MIGRLEAEVPSRAVRPQPCRLHKIYRRPSRELPRDCCGLLRKTANYIVEALPADDGFRRFERSHGSRCGVGNLDGEQLSTKHQRDYLSVAGRNRLVSPTLTWNTRSDNPVSRSLGVLCNRSLMLNNVLSAVALSCAAALENLSPS